MTKLEPIPRCPVRPWITTHIYAKKRDHLQFSKMIYNRFHYLTEDEQKFLKDYCDRLDSFYEKYMRISIEEERFKKRYHEEPTVFGV